MLRLAVPILPEHIWKNIDEKEVTTFDNERERGSAPARSSRRAQHRPVRTWRLAANKTYWGGAPRSTRSSTASSTTPTPCFRRSRRARSTSPTGSSRRPSTPSRAPRASLPSPATTPVSTAGLQHRGRPGHGEPIGDGHPAPQGQAGPTGLDHAVDKKALVDRVLGGNGTAATGSSPPSTEPDLQPAAGEATTSTWPRPSGCWTGRLQGQRRRRGRGDDGSRPLKFRLFAGRSPTPPSSRSQFIQGWLRDIGIAIDGQGGGGEQPDREHRPGRVRHVRVGLGGRARPGLPAVDLHLRRAGLQGRRQRLANLSD